MVDEPETKTMFTKRYKMRSVGNDGLNTTVSIPRMVLQREANKLGITLNEFLKNYQAVAMFDNINKLYYIFEKISEVK